MIHCYKLGGLNIVLDICSGSVHVVDEVAYDLIEVYEGKTREELCELILNKYPDRADVTKEEILSSRFTLVTPNSKNPYKQMYASN